MYIVAEMSANHGQQFEQALTLVRAARDAGADAIKLQTYTPDTLTIACQNEHFRIKGGTLWDGRTLYELQARPIPLGSGSPSSRQRRSRLD